MLHASHLRKEFANVLAVDDISFTVHPGQVFGLIGPNGAGKSTTIKMVMDILQPDRGEILIDKHPFNATTRNIVGYLPEERGLYRKSKLINVIRYFGGLKGLDARQATAAAMPWLERFSLKDHVKRNVEELSKGNQQKVQFIISVLHNPRLLVLDELFSGLDPINQALMKDALLEFKKASKAIIFSTHMMDLAERMCDDITLINKGRIVLEGPPMDIKKRFGRNSVRVEFQGDGSFIPTLPDVQKADVFQNYAEIELRENAPTNDLVSHLLPKLEVSSFARIEPSLQSIFIDTVGMPAEAEEEAPTKIAPKKAIQDKRVKREFTMMIINVLLVAILVPVLLRDMNNPLPIVPILILAPIISVAKFIRIKRKVEKELLAAEKEVQS